MKKIIPLILITLMACGKRPKALEQPFGSIKELAEHHISCIALKSPECLSGRLLTKQEFHDSVYPFLPESNDKLGRIEEDVYWGWTLPDRQKAFKRLFDQFGGLKLIKLSIGEPKKIVKYGPIKVYRDISLFAEFLDAANNKTLQIASPEILKAVVEVKGEFKLWNTTYE